MEGDHTHFSAGSKHVKGMVQSIREPLKLRIHLNPQSLKRSGRGVYWPVPVLGRNCIVNDVCKRLCGTDRPRFAR